MSLALSVKTSLKMRRLKAQARKRSYANSAVSLDTSKCAYIAVQIPIAKKLPQAMAIRYPNADKNTIIGVPEHLMCAQYFMTPVPVRYRVSDYERAWMAVPISLNAPLVMVVHCPQRDTAFRIRVPKSIHKTSVKQFVVDLSKNVAEVVRVQVPKGSRTGDSIIVNLPKPKLTFSIVLPSGEYGKYITVRVPQKLSSFGTVSSYHGKLAITDGREDDVKGNSIEINTLVTSNVEVKKVIREIFESIDTDGSGRIDRCEMKPLMDRLMTSEAASDVFDSIDENHDNSIDPSEFETYILRRLSHSTGLNSITLLERIQKEGKQYADRTTITAEFDCFVNFLKALQVPVPQAEAQILWEEIVAAESSPTYHDFVGIFEYALHVSFASSGDLLRQDKRLFKVLHSMAASLCVNELLRRLRGIIDTPSNFAQPLLGRLVHRSIYCLSNALDCNDFFRMNNNARYEIFQSSYV